MSARQPSYLLNYTANRGSVVELQEGRASQGIVALARIKVCDDFIVVLGAGNSPERNLRCVDNAYCDLVNNTVKGTGTCTPLPTFGKPCGNEYAGLACNARTGGPTNPRATVHPRNTATFSPSSSCATLVASNSSFLMMTASLLWT
jgi:hypothetical protein